MRLPTTTLVGAALAAPWLASAHPGQDARAELLERRQFVANSARTDLSHCAGQIKARGLEQRGIERRRALLEKKKAKRGVVVEKRAPDDINKSHLSGAGFGSDTALDTVFAANASCILSPEETEGPYYVAGEYVRQDVVEGQDGVAVTIDVDIVNVETCEPVTDVWVEIWQANATGVYSGVNSGADYAAAPQNLNTTFLRGLQQTDADGAIQFDTLFPGHYDGRTQHIHVMVHPNATVRANGTVLDLGASHVGQMYFDQSLIDQVETLAPYSTNTQAITTNAEDYLLTDGLATSDPIMEYVLMGDTVADGLLAWLSFGINTTYTYTASAASTLYADGGVANDLGGGGGAGPGGAGPGGPPPTK